MQRNAHATAIVPRVSNTVLLLQNPHCCLNLGSCICQKWGRFPLLDFTTAWHMWHRHASFAHAIATATAYGACAVHSSPKHGTLTRENVRGTSFRALSHCFWPLAWALLHRGAFPLFVGPLLGPCSIAEPFVVSLAPCLGLAPLWSLFSFRWPLVWALPH